MTGLPILGKLPVLPESYLKSGKCAEIASIVEANVDMDKVIALAGGRANE